jgi:hypothetical protein
MNLFAQLFLPTQDLADPQWVRIVRAFLIWIKGTTPTLPSLAPMTEQNGQSGGFSHAREHR